MPYKYRATIGIRRSTRDLLGKIISEKGLDKKYNSWDEFMLMIADKIMKGEID